MIWGFAGDTGAQQKSARKYVKKQGSLPSQANFKKL
jgi:hypothetical protein